MANWSFEKKLGMNLIFFSAQFQREAPIPLMRGALYATIALGLLNFFNEIEDALKNLNSKLLISSDLKRSEKNG